MDFIETWFGVSPDGGDGSLEALWVTAAVIAVVAIVFRRKIIAFVAARFASRE
jgi:hypothetical protein